MPTNTDIDPDLDLAASVGLEHQVTDADLADDLGPDRVRLARERWDVAQRDLFEVLPPEPRPAGAQSHGAPPPGAEVVRGLVLHAQGAYADYLTELQRLHSS